MMIRRKGAKERAPMRERERGRGRWRDREKERENEGRVVGEREKRWEVRGWKGGKGASI
jgi:hypothetical protein